MILGAELQLKQHLTITPQLQQALRLLQLSSLEFAQEVEHALSTNPFLEEDESAPTGAAPVGSPGDAAEDPPTDKAAETGESAVDPESASAVDEPAYAEEDRGRRTSSSGEENDWTEWSEAPVGLRQHLRSQLLLSPMGDRDRALAQLVIDEINEDGYLETPIEELAALVAPEHEVEAQEMLAAVKLVQCLDPPGIAARSLQECLQLQLDALPAHTPGRPIARRLVAEYFALLARREFARIQQLAACSETELHTARSLIRRLDPKPGRRFGPDDTRYVVPDIIVMRSHGGWIATINPAVQPRVRINRAYAEIAACRGGCETAFAHQLQEARWLLRNVEKRFATIQRVADAIVTRQRNFFNYGPLAMKPLALKDIADELGLHESTVCRVTNGKYMATPRGLFEFTYFFSRQLATRDGGACSATAIRALLKELIAAEDPANPLSDVQLARLLSNQGLRLARRTVTKYRTLMHLPSVELRRVAGHPENALPRAGPRA